MIISCINQKGGVGKTTTIIHLGYGLSILGKKVLIIDIDPQDNCTSIFLDEEKNPPDKTINDLFLKKRLDIRETIYPAYTDEQEIKNLKIIPAVTFDVDDKESAEEYFDLEKVEQLITTKLNRQKILSDHLAKIKNEFDYILIDCRPGLGPLSENAIYAAELILIPTDYSKFSLDGMDKLFKKIREVKEGENYQYRVLKNKYDARNKQTNEAIDSQLEEFSGNILKTIINRCEAINQAQMNEETIFTYSPKSVGVEDFNKLVKEIMNHG
jgi:chromosome partitioning protein